jgi:hypothetical protein
MTSDGRMSSDLEGIVYDLGEPLAEEKMDMIVAGRVVVQRVLYENRSKVRNK